MENTDKKIKILMIEDDPEFAELLSEYLSQFNMEITNYEDPFLGVSAGVQNYDLLLLDLTLPGMDGLEVGEEVVGILIFLVDYSICKRWFYWPKVEG